MKISWDGILEIAEHEAVVPGPYKDSKGIWTYGVGHTRGAGAPNPAKMPRGMPVDRDAEVIKALKLFDRDLDRYEARVNEALRVPVKQHEFDALVSFDFNTGGIFKAKLTKAINAGDRNAARHFMGWAKPPEIRERREREMNLFKTGRYSPAPIPIYSVNKAGRRGGIIGHVADVDILAHMGKRKRLSFLTTLISILRKIFGR